MRFGGHSTAYGAPEAEFDLPYGHMGQNTGYAMIAQRYAAQYGYDQAAMAKICVDQRTNALSNPDAMFFGKPLTVEDVLGSKMVADPLHVLEIVMPVAGGAAVIVTSKELAAKTKHRPAFVKGFGERLSFKSPSYANDMTVTPVAAAAKRAFEMAGGQAAGYGCGPDLRLLHHHRVAVAWRMPASVPKGRGCASSRRTT